jgi:transmembrane sensor
MEERIKYLFRKYLSNTCTKEEFDEIFFHLQSRDNDVSIGKSIEEAYEQEYSSPVTRKNYRPLLSIAAAILIIILAGTAWLMNGDEEKKPLIVQRAPEKITIKATERSEYKYLLLPDSTQVWLNAESTLEFPENFNQKRREVYLKGEAYFDVKHADKVPFIIYTGKVSTEVLGTAFNIKAYPDLAKITVSVKRGRVKVNYADEQVAMLTKGQQVSIDQKEKKVKEKSIKDEESSAWHEGNLIYDDYSVADVLADLARIYDVKITIDAAETEKMRITTSFKREHGVESALEIICKLTDSHVQLKNGVYNIIK